MFCEALRFKSQDDSSRVTDEPRDEILSNIKELLPCASSFPTPITPLTQDHTLSYLSSHLRTADPPGFFPRLWAFYLKKALLYLVPKFPLLKFTLTLAWIAWDLPSFPFTSPTTEVVMALASRRPGAALASSSILFSSSKISSQGILVGLSFPESQHLFATPGSRHLGGHNGRCYCWGLHLSYVGSSNSSCYFLFESSSPK